jgi:hypothetical protein
MENMHAKDFFRNAAVGMKSGFLEASIMKKPAMHRR